MQSGREFLKDKTRADLLVNGVSEINSALERGVHFHVQGSF